MAAQIADEHPDLTRLNLMRNPITDKCLIHLGRMKSLRELNLSQTDTNIVSVLNLALDLPVLQTLTISSLRTAAKRKIETYLYALAAKGVTVVFMD